MSLPDHLLEPEEAKPECTGNVWECRCRECLSEWIDRQAEERYDHLRRT